MVVSVFAHGESSHSLTILSLSVVYAVTTSLLLAHRQQWFELNQAHASDSKLGAVGGGVGAFTDIYGESPRVQSDDPIHELSHA
jgi:hypothetical protein